MARPVEFNRDEVLKRAMEQFWEMGYTSTSMNDLVRVTGLKPGSIYAAFKSKESLLLDSIDYYGKRSVARIEQSISQSTNPLSGIKQFLHNLKMESQQDTQKRGCFMVNTVLEVAPHNQKVKRKVSQYLGQIESIFVKALQDAQQQQLLGPEKRPRELARFLMPTIWGIRVMQRISSNKNDFEIATRQFLSLLV